MSLNQIAVITGVLIFSYLLGAIPTAYWVCKKLAGVDIREQGSGNVGANNTRRVVGNFPAMGVMIFDILKGLIPVLLARHLEIELDIYPHLSILAALAGFVAVVGHTKSVFINFTGGKGAATGAGTLLGLYWPVAIIVGLLSAFLAKVLKFKSAGVYLVVPAAAVLMWIFKQPVSYIAYCIVVSLYMLFLFRTNLKIYLDRKTAKES